MSDRKPVSGSIIVQSSCCGRTEREYSWTVDESHEGILVEEKPELGDQVEPFSCDRHLGSGYGKVVEVTVERKHEQ